MNNEREEEEGKEGKKEGRKERRKETIVRCQGGKVYYK
jgi:hypothetical protein